MNYRPEVQVNGNWLASDLVFATEEEARQFAFSIFDVWVLALNFRAVPTDSPVNSFPPHFPEKLNNHG